MTKIEKYICDFCGKEFDDEDDCLRHELVEEFENSNMTTIVFGRNYQEISITDLFDNFTIEAFQILDEEEISIFEKILNYVSIISPWDIDGGELAKKKGLYVWDYNLDVWFMPTERIQENEELLEKYGVDE